MLDITKDRRSPEFRAWLEEAYSVSRRPVRSIAEDMGCAPHTVRTWLRFHGIPIRKKTVQLRRNGTETAPGCMDGETLDGLLRDMKAQGMTYREIADELDCSYSAVCRRLRAAGERRESRGLMALAARPGMEEFLRRAYLDERRSGDDIGAELGCSDRLVLKLLRYFAIPIRENRRKNGRLDHIEGEDRFAFRERLVFLYRNLNLRRREIAAILGCTEKDVEFLADKYGVSRKTREELGTRTFHGYAYAYEPEHEYADEAGRVAEHRLAMERVLGGPLPYGLRVYHIDGDALDNGPENLAILSRPGLTAFLASMAAMRRRTGKLAESLGIDQDASGFVPGPVPDPYDGGRDAFVEILGRPVPEEMLAGRLDRLGGDGTENLFLAVPEAYVRLSDSIRRAHAAQKALWDASFERAGVPCPPPEEDSDGFADWLRDAIAVRGLTRKELCGLLGWPKSYMEKKALGIRGAASGAGPAPDGGIREAAADAAAELDGGIRDAARPGSEAGRKTVWHRMFGEGTVESETGARLTVLFGTGPKTFVLPGAFRDGYLFNSEEEMQAAMSTKSIMKTVFIDSPEKALKFAEAAEKAERAKGKKVRAKYDEIGIGEIGEMFGVGVPGKRK